MSIALSPAAIIRRNNTTPGRLKLMMGLTWVLAGLFCLFAFVGTVQHQHAIQTVGRDSAPSVVAAHGVLIDVETLDADLVNELLVAPGTNPDAVKDFDKTRLDLSDQLVAAAQNITYGDAEKKPITRLQEFVGRFQMEAQAARDAHDLGNAAGMLAHYHNAYDILEKQLAPAAHDLNTANDSVLQATYQAQSTESLISLTLTIVFGLLCIGSLVMLQLYIRSRFHRRFSLTHAVATALALGLLFYTAHAFVAQSHDLKGVKEDSYDSVAALLDARADAYEANAAESRWLLDTPNRAEHERVFKEFAGKLAAFGKGQSFQTANAITIQRNASMKQLLEHGSSASSAGAQARQQFPMTQEGGFQGSLITELNNITFPNLSDPVKDEPTQAAQTLKSWGVYYERDAKIRALENSGHHDQAVAFNMGMNPDQSNYAFFQFDKSLGNTLTINEDWMETYTKAGFADLAGLVYIIPLCFIALALLTLFGVKPRLSEYAG